MWNGAATLENNMQVPKKIKNRMTRWSSNPPPLGIYPMETKNTNSKRYMLTHVYCSVIYNSQEIEAI